MKKQGIFEPKALQNLLSEHKDFKAVAVGTGAFMLKDFKGVQETTLEANPNYWEKGADGKALPYIDGVRSLVFPDQVGVIAALRTGQIDHTGAFGLTKRDADQMRQSNPGLRYYPQFVLSFQGLWFNLKKKPFDNQKVRQAVSLALNREDVFASLGGPDAAIYASFVPPFLTDFAWPQDKAKQKYRQDLDAAKKLMAESGVAPGDLTGLTMRTAGQYQQEAEAVQKQLQAIGIQPKMEIDSVTFSAILQKGDFDLGWGAYSGGPFANFWVGDFIRSDSNQNFIKLNDSRVDQLAIAQGKELDLAKRKQIIDQLHDRLYESMPYAPMATNFYHHFMACKVKNAMLANPTYNTPIALQAWIDPTGC
ncbi:MAG: ABC transporter substrate-binding protein [Chloroflexota bacterium]